MARTSHTHLTTGFRLNRRQLPVLALAVGAAASTPMGNMAPSVVAQDAGVSVPMFRGNAARTGEMPGPAPDAKNGVEERWSLTTIDRLTSSPAVVDGTVFVGSGAGVGSTDRHVYALDAQDGSERWRFAAGDAVNSSPVVVDGVVFFGSVDHHVYAIDVRNGSERWRFETGDAVFSSPAVADGMVFVGSNDGKLHALGARIPRLEPGAKARITTKTTLRGAPNPHAIDRGTLNEDTIVFVTGMSEAAGNLVWWPITVDTTGAMGWIEETALEPIGNG